MNVLEHIKDDTKAISNFYQLLKPKGKLILIVPAFSWLYGSVDKSDHHFRRYTKSSIKEIINNSGLKILDLKYMNFLGIFGWYLNGKILRKEVVHNGMLSFYDKVIPLIFKIEAIIPPPFGLSLFCVAEKNDY